MGFWKASTSRRFGIIWKDLKAVGRGSVSIAIGAIAGGLSSGGEINWKTIGVTALSTLLVNIAQRIGGTSTYPPDSPVVQ